MAFCVGNKGSGDLNGQAVSVTEGVSNIRWMLEKQAKVGRVRPSRPDRGGIVAAESKSLLLSIESNGVAFFSGRVFVTADAEPCRAQAARANVQKTNPLRLPLYQSLRLSILHQHY